MTQRTAKPPDIRIRPLASRVEGAPLSLAARLDRALVDAVPWVDRYCWETVIVLEH